MLKNKYLLLSICVAMNFGCLAQSDYSLLHKNDFASVKYWVIKFLKEKDAISDSSFFIAGLSNSFTYPFDLHHVAFTPGVYKFGSNLTHSVVRLLIVGKKSSYILTNYKPTYVLTMVGRQIENLQIKDNEKQLSIIQNVMLALKQILEIE